MQMWVVGSFPCLSRGFLESVVLLSFLVNTTPDSNGIPAGHSVLDAISVPNKSYLRVFMVNMS